MHKDGTWTPRPIYMSKSSYDLYDRANTARTEMELIVI